MHVHTPTMSHSMWVLPLEVLRNHILMPAILGEGAYRRSDLNYTTVHKASALLTTSCKQLQAMVAKKARRSFRLVCKKGLLSTTSS